MVLSSTIIKVPKMIEYGQKMPQSLTAGQPGMALLVGQISNNFKKNHAFYDKSMKIGTWLVDSNTKK